MVFGESAVFTAESLLLCRLLAQYGQSNAKQFLFIVHSLPLDTFYFASIMDYFAKTLDTRPIAALTCNVTSTYIANSETSETKSY